MKRFAMITLGWSLAEPSEHQKEVKGRVAALLQQLGLEDRFDPTKHYYNVRLEVGSQAFKTIIDELRNDSQVGYLSRIEKEYTNSELEAASLLIFRITNQSIKDDHYNMYPNRDRRGIGPPYRQCTACRAPLEQIRDLFLNPHHMGKKDVSLTYMFDVIFSERMASILHECTVSGFQLRTVQNYGARGEEAQQLYQLQVTSTLPPMLVPPTEFDPIRHCPVCRTTSYFLKRSHQWGNLRYYEDTDAYYPGAVLDAAQDLNYTTEWFGELPVMKPIIIISQRIFRLLRDQGIKNWEAIPVQLID